MELKLNRPICFFDLETTGINITNDRIIEIAVIKMMPNGEILRKSSLLNPTVPIPLESSLIHGNSTTVPETRRRAAPRADEITEWKGVI